MKTLLNFETIQPQTPAQYAIIWLHGLGADGYDFMPIVPKLKLDDLPIRYIFPHAPHRPVTLNRGMVMPAWFDIHEISSHARYDEQGIEAAYQTIGELIENEHQQHIPYERILLIGFSQGGALALYTGLRFSHRLAGIVGLSTFLPHTTKLKHELITGKQNPPPVYLAHGTNDPIVPVESGQMTAELLTHEGFSVDWHTYPMAHQVCAPEIKDLSAWIRNVLTT